MCSPAQQYEDSAIKPRMRESILHERVAVLWTETRECIERTFWTALRKLYCT